MKKALKILKHGQIRYGTSIMDLHVLYFSLGSDYLGVWIRRWKEGFKITTLYYLKGERNQSDPLTTIRFAEVVELQGDDLELAENVLQERVDEIRRVIFSEML